MIRTPERPSQDDILEEEDKENNGVVNRRMNDNIQNKSSSFLNASSPVGRPQQQTNDNFHQGDISTSSTSSPSTRQKTFQSGFTPAVARWGFVASEQRQQRQIRRLEKAEERRRQEMETRHKDLQRNVSRRSQNYYHKNQNNSVDDGGTVSSGMLNAHLRNPSTSHAAAGNTTRNNLSILDESMNETSLEYQETSLHQGRTSLHQVGRTSHYQGRTSHYQDTTIQRQDIYNPISDNVQSKANHIDEQPQRDHPTTTIGINKSEKVGAFRSYHSTFTDKRRHSQHAFQPLKRKKKKKSINKKETSKDHQQETILPYDDHDDNDERTHQSRIEDSETTTDYFFQEEDKAYRDPNGDRLSREAAFLAGARASRDERMAREKMSSDVSVDDERSKHDDRRGNGGRRGAGGNNPPGKRRTATGSSKDHQEHDEESPSSFWC
eukprot:g2474.t1